jgi:hypothetical protein
VFETLERHGASVRDEERLGAFLHTCAVRARLMLVLARIRCDRDWVTI